MSTLPWKEVSVCDGVVIVDVLEENLSDFRWFMRCIIAEKVGLSQGFFKVRVRGGSHATSLETFCKYAHAYMTKKASEESSEVELHKQDFFYGSLKEDVYGFQKSECSKYQLNSFLVKISEPTTFMSGASSCCAAALAGAPEELERHCWGVVRKLSAKSVSLGKHYKKSEIDALLKEGAKNRAKFCEEQSLCEDVNTCALPINRCRGSSRKEPVLYCPGIPVNCGPFFVCKNFSLSSLGTVLDLLPEPIPGITFPYLYIGSKHATFPWHMEDQALFSINVIHYGAPCVWFFVSPSQYMKFAEVCKFLPLLPEHVSCSMVMLHKFILASRMYLLKFGIEAQMIVQEQGEIVVTYPFTAHSGMKMGYNISEAANFADPWWVEPAMVAPPCKCIDTNFVMDMKEIVAATRPHLLSMYLQNDVLGLMNAVKDNSFIKSIGLLPAVSHFEPEVGSKVDGGAADEPHVVDEEVVPLFKGSRYTLTCPEQGCTKVFEGGRAKRCRMEEHIRKNHGGSEELLQQFCAKNPSKVVKSSVLICPVCNKQRAGNRSHLKKHIVKMHSEVADQYTLF